MVNNHGPGHKHGHDKSAVWAGLVGFAGIYIFFLTERLIALFAEWRRNRRAKILQEVRYTCNVIVVAIIMIVCDSQINGIPESKLSIVSFRAVYLFEYKNAVVRVMMLWCTVSNVYTVTNIWLMDYLSKKQHKSQADSAQA